MGSFYVNLSVKIADTTKLSAWLKHLDDKVFLGPVQQGWAVVVSEALEIQDQDVINRLGEGISKDLSAAVLAVSNHDSDILSVDLFEGGVATAEYNSCPGYFDEDADDEDLLPRLSGGDRLASLTSLVSEKELQDALMKEQLFADETHLAVAKLIGLPEYSVGAGFRYVQRGETEANWVEL